MAPAVVLLDVNETLSDLSPLGDRFEEAGARRELLDTWFAATLRDGIGLAAAGGYAGFREIAAGVLDSMLGPAGRDRVLDGMASLGVHADVEPGLRRLREAGIRLATLTNGSAQMTEDLLERAGLRDLVERCMSVEEAGRWKPAPEPYLHACRELGVPLGDALMVAVHPWDVDGAMRAGLGGAWINRGGGAYPAVFREPSLTAPDLVELAAALGA